MGWLKNRRTQREAEYFSRTGRRSCFSSSVTTTPIQLQEIWKLGLTILQPGVETAIIDLFPPQKATWKRQFDALPEAARSAYLHLVSATGASAQGEMQVKVDVTDPSNFLAVCDYGLHSNSGHHVSFDMTTHECNLFRTALTDAGVPISLVEDLENQ